MKIPACMGASFDETLMLKKEIPGFLSVEKCYINGFGQYWYNITGKQALDSYTKMKEIGIRFVEKLLLQICTQLERLEWNLLGTHCMVLDPEFIFVGKAGEEISFLLYPDNKGEVQIELRKLVEYLLTRLNHKDSEAVKTLYEIYEITLAEGYSLEDIRWAIEKNKASQDKDVKKEINKKQDINKDISYEKTYEKSTVKAVEHSLDQKEKSKVSWMETFKGKLKRLSTLEIGDQSIERLWDKAMSVLKPKEPTVVYPEKSDSMGTSRPKEVPRTQTNKSYQLSSPPVTNPTVCLVSTPGKERGVLMHQGLGAYPDYELSKRRCEIGNHPKADLYIEKDTISGLHAGIDYQDGQYYIEDFNSTNGTYVNEVPLCYKQKLKLTSGDEIRFGDVRYRFL